MTYVKVDNKDELKMLCLIHNAVIWNEPKGHGFRTVWNLIETYPRYCQMTSITMWPLFHTPIEKHRKTNIVSYKDFIQALRRHNVNIPEL